MDAAEQDRRSGKARVTASFVCMPLSLTHTPVYVLDLDQSLPFYTDLLGFEIHVDAPAGPDMRWLTLIAPGSKHEMLLASIDQHLPLVDRQAMRELVAKGNLAVFIEVDDLDRVFETLRDAGVEVLQEPIDQPYGIRDCGVRDPSGNHVRLSQALDNAAGSKQ